MNYKKTFKTKALTSKGNFDIEITVWKESLEPYANVSRWTFDGFVLVDGRKFILNSYWKTIGTSQDMMKSFGVSYDTKFKADFSEVINYRQSIDRKENEKSTRYEEEFNKEMANIGL